MFGFGISLIGTESPRQITAIAKKNLGWIYTENNQFLLCTYALRKWVYKVGMLSYFLLD